MFTGHPALSMSTGHSALSALSMSTGHLALSVSTGHLALSMSTGHLASWLQSLETIASYSLVLTINRPVFAFSTLSVPVNCLVAELVL